MALRYSLSLSRRSPNRPSSNTGTRSGRIGYAPSSSPPPCATPNPGRGHYSSTSSFLKLSSSSLSLLPRVSAVVKCRVGAAASVLSCSSSLLNARRRSSCLGGDSHPRFIAGGYLTPGIGKGARVEAAAGADVGGGDGDGDVVHITPNGRILLIGITGVTGRSALQGLLTSAGPSRSSLIFVAMTRSPTGAGARSLPGEVQVITGDLDEPGSLEHALRGVTAIYCHALSKDAATADPAELVRARTLAAAAKAAGVRLIIYNSTGGRGCGYGITQMDQKHCIEDILAESVPTVSLRASMFMEELWKRYTRPGILKGAFTWATPSDRPIQLVAARDMGLVAGHLLAGSATAAAAAATADGAADVRVPRLLDDGAPPEVGATGATGGDQGEQMKPQRRLRLRAIELSGDELTPDQICQAFSKVQASPVRHNQAPVWPFWFLARDVYRIARFLTERGYDGDVAACRAQFPGMLTFEDFLRATEWADIAKKFEDGFTFASEGSPRQPPPTEPPTS